jgi:hypothetical protein
MIQFQGVYRVGEPKKALKWQRPPLLFEYLQLKTPEDGVYLSKSAKVQIYHPAMVSASAPLSNTFSSAPDYRTDVLHSAYPVAAPARFQANSTAAFSLIAEKNGLGMNAPADVTCWTVVGGFC